MSSAPHRWFCLWAISVVALLLALAQTAKANLAAQNGLAESAAAESVPFPVEIDGRPIVIIYTSLGGVSPEERAAKIQERILRFARNRALSPDTINAKEIGPWAEIRAGQDVIMAVTEGDAAAQGRSRLQVAQEYAEVIRRAVVIYRQEHTLRSFLRGILFSVLSTVGMVVLILALFRLRRLVRSQLESLIRRAEEKFTLQSIQSRMARYFLVPVIGTGIIIVTAAVVVILEIYIILVLGFFPSTRYFGYQLNRWTVSELAAMGHTIWAYLPNLVVVVVIVVAARALIRLNDYVFREIDQGTVTVRGFYPDWARPTAKLVRLLMLAVTAVVIFPYLPGSESPAFRGISVFLGVLLSLGSTSAVAHGVAGTILVYMRSFSVGDFVKIADTVGEVIEKTLLVTRISTQKKEIVTIPNGSVLGGVVVNFSAEARKSGVIFYTRVSLGYSTPWPKVHELLISAALATKGVLEYPKPFVLQSSLDDFCVAYELNAFTGNPQNMQFIYSDLHQNIQDKFHQAGIEINTPHYLSVRDGNPATIPEQYLPKNYHAPAFRFREMRGPDGMWPGSEEGTKHG